MKDGRTPFPVVLGDGEKDDVIITACSLCGKIIAVDVDLAVGQHVLCPYCGKKFSWSENASVQEQHTENESQRREKGERAREDWRIGEAPKEDLRSRQRLAKPDKGRIASILSRYEEKLRNREWVRSTITHALVVVGLLVAATVAFSLFFHYRIEIDTRLELRNGLAEFIRSNHQMLTDRYSQYSASVRNLRNEMWYSRGDRTTMDRLRVQVSRLLKVQSAIDAVERDFSEVAPRLDEMSIEEIKSTQDRLSRCVRALTMRFERFEADPLGSGEKAQMFSHVSLRYDVPQSGTRSEAMPQRNTDRKDWSSAVQNVRLLSKTGSEARLQAQIDAIIAKLKNANYSFDIKLLDEMNLEDRLAVLSEMLYDVEKQKRRIVNDN